jgi:hypothetical protein
VARRFAPEDLHRKICTERFAPEDMSGIHPPQFPKLVQKARFLSETKVRLPQNKMEGTRKEMRIDLKHESSIYSIVF